MPGNSSYYANRTNQQNLQRAQEAERLKKEASLKNQIAILNKQVKVKADLANDPFANTGKVIYDANGRPIDPEWRRINDKEGKLLPSMELNPWQNVNSNREALDSLRQDGLRQAGTNSVWGNQMLAKQQADQTQAMDNAQLANANVMNQLTSQMAQTGGIDSGARNRLAKQSMRELLNQKAQVNRQGSLDKMNINLQDEQNRISGLGNIQNMENQQTDYAIKNQSNNLETNRFNIQNRLGEADKQRMFDLERYKEAMGGWAAGKSADAQKSAAKSGKK